MDYTFNSKKGLLTSTAFNCCSIYLFTCLFTSHQIAESAEWRGVLKISAFRAPYILGLTVLGEKSFHSPY